MTVTISASTSDDGPDDAAAAPPVVVRRNAGLAAVIGAAASAIAIAYLWRATQTGSVLDWALCVVVAGIAVLHLTHLVDARTPLLVADDLGVRMRFRHQWRGMPWEAVDTVAVTPRRGLHDGRLTFGPHSPPRALDGLGARGRRAVALNQRLYGAAMAVPLGLTTRVSLGNDRLLDALETLSAGRADVVVLRPAKDVEAAAEEPADQEGSQEPEDQEPEDQQPEELRHRRLVARSVLPFGSARRALRAHAEHPQSDTTLGNAARLPEQAEHAEPDRRGSLPEGDALRPHGGFELDPPRSAYGRPQDDLTVRPMATLAPAVVPLVVDDFLVEPAHDPVIGPELAAARHRTGLSVDQLAERTRIRPHVIESIEVDDFAPCGGDFYARGHLRTLARVLGRDPERLVATFDARYATAPINARKVFEAELATGMTGSMRRTTGGPSWALLVGVVLALVLLWGVVRLFATEPQEKLQPVPALSGSTGVAAEPGSSPSSGAKRSTGAAVTAPRPLQLRLVAAHAASHVVVRDRAGTVVWAGDLALDQAHTLRATAPVTVRATDGGAIDVAVAGHAVGRVGVLGRPGHRTFQHPAAR